MKHIVMPAKRLTADCIRNSFQSSGKRHLIITGGRGSGKTTLLSELFPEKLPGLTSRAEKGKAVYLRDNLSDKEVQIGAFFKDLTGSENRMLPALDGFVSFGVPTLKSCAEGESEWVTIDEIGYLEADCAEYREALKALFDKKRVAAVVRKQKLPFLEELCNREDAFVVDLDTPFGFLGCVIMASGEGKRFGGNKLMADFDGEPMISRILDVTEGIFTRRVVVTRHSDVAELCGKYDVQVVLHNLPYRSDTVRLGIEAVGDVERCMFTPADQPLLRRETVEALALASKNAPAFIWRAAYGDAEGSPVIFPKNTFDELLKVPEGKGGGAVIKKHPGLIRTTQVYDINELKDVDTREELKALLNH